MSYSPSLLFSYTTSPLTNLTTNIHLVHQLTIEVKTVNFVKLNLRTVDYRLFKNTLIVITLLVCMNQQAEHPMLSSFWLLEVYLGLLFIPHKACFQKAKTCEEIEQSRLKYGADKVKGQDFI